MTFSENVVEAAHRHCACNRTEVLDSEICGCFYCLSVFSPSKIIDWIKEVSGDFKGGVTAQCPECSIDSVIGSKSGYPVNSPDFLSDMHAYWFERTVNA